MTYESFWEICNAWQFTQIQVRNFIHFWNYIEAQLIFGERSCVWVMSVVRGKSVMNSCRVWSRVLRSTFYCLGCRVSRRHFIRKFLQKLIRFVLVNMVNKDEYCFCAMINTMAISMVPKGHQNPRWCGLLMTIQMRKLKSDPLKL